MEQEQGRGSEGGQGGAASKRVGIQGRKRFPKDGERSSVAIVAERWTVRRAEA